MLGQMCADRHKDRVEAALAPHGLEVFDPVSGNDPNPQRGDPLQLGSEHRTR